MTDKKGLHTHEAWFKVIEITSTSTSKETFASAQGLNAKETIDMLRSVKELMKDP